MRVNIPMQLSLEVEFSRIYYVHGEMKCKMGQSTK